MGECSTDDAMKRMINLACAGTLTAAFIIMYFFIFEHQHLDLSLRCWKKAPTLWSCYRQDFDFTTDFFGLRYEGNMGNLLDQHIFYYGAYEKPILFFFRDLVESGGADRRIFLDIGANVGQHSLFMSKFVKTVHAFEPYEPVLKRFRRLIEINGIKNVIIHSFGLGNEDSKKPFYRPPNINLGIGSFVPDFSKENTPDSALEIHKGDDVLEYSGIGPVGLIKMDIEGYEKPALLGLQRTLRKDRPVIAFELTVNPQSSISIKNKDDLQNLFPPQYRFVFFGAGTDADTGAYSFSPGDQIRFDTRSRYDIVAYPVEKENPLFHNGSRN